MSYIDMGCVTNSSILLFWVIDIRYYITLEALWRICTMHCILSGREKKYPRLGGWHALNTMWILLIAAQNFAGVFNIISNVANLQLFLCSYLNFISPWSFSRLHVSNWVHVLDLLFASSYKHSLYLCLQCCFWLGIYALHRKGADMMKTCINS